MQEVNGLIVRSRFQQNVEEERATLFHQNKEVKMNHKRRLSKIKLLQTGASGEGQQAEDQDVIAEEC